MNIIHQYLILIFKYIILKKIIYNDKLLKNSFIIHEKLKELIIILNFIIRSHFLDFDIKLSFDFKIKLHEYINDFILDEYSFDLKILSKIIYKDNKITEFILENKKQIINIRMNKIKKLF